ncbi:HlyD family type I secretion periplasmic adaptor subunit, partial [Hellea sp.]|nr:HlyD family type I secretion periplasmic adaptor subunit [Hellea sp.]
PYDKFLRMGFIAIFFLIGIGIVWGSIAQIKGAVIAPGVVVVEGKPKTLQHLDGGIVGEIFVKDGDVVQEGDVLMQLDPTMLGANEELVNTRLRETMARVARLEAERDSKSAITWPEDLMKAENDPMVASAMLGQEKLFMARRIAASGQVEQLKQRIAQSKDQIDGLNSLISSKESQAMKIREEAQAKRTLVEKGWLAKPVILTLEREELRLKGDVANHQSEIARLINSISETNVQILQLQRERQAEVLTELRQADTEASDFKEQLTTASDQLRRIDVIAPVTGKVHNMTVTTVGGVVAPGQEIMQIIPADDRLIIEAQVEPADIDQIYPGQKTTVRLSAFNMRTTPEMNGLVIQSSADRLIDQVTGLPYYSVKIEIPPSELGRLPENLTLLPGMPAESFMQTDSRSVLSYLLKPATDAMDHTFREE